MKSRMASLSPVAAMSRRIRSGCAAMPEPMSLGRGIENASSLYEVRQVMRAMPPPWLSSSVNGSVGRSL